MEIPHDDEAQKYRFHSIYKFFVALVFSDCNLSKSNFLIRNCRSGEYMCNVLITAGITEIEPVPGVVFAHAIPGLTS